MPVSLPGMINRADPDLRGRLRQALQRGSNYLACWWGVEGCGGGMMSCVFLVFFRSDCLQPGSGGWWKGEWEREGLDV